MDGLDAAVAELEWDGGAVAMSPLRHIERPWPDEVRARLHASLGPTTAGELCELDQLIGQASAELAAELLPADLVVSHGQTVHHWVQDGEAKGTLQLGQPAWIVEATGLPVISDVRARDIAAGGHGAPLAGILDDLWLRGEHTRAALNLGGIANVTIVRRGRPPLAFDTGPANCLLDEAARRTTGRPSDEDGRFAARGSPDAALLPRPARRPRLRTRATEVDRPRALPPRRPAGSRARGPAGDADGADRDHRRRRARTVRARRGRRVRGRRPQPGAARRARAPPPAHRRRRARPARAGQGGLPDGADRLPRLAPSAAAHRTARARTHLSRRRAARAPAAGRPAHRPAHPNGVKPIAERSETPGAKVSAASIDLGAVAFVGDRSCCVGYRRVVS